ncbi:hypothetical protein FACS1894125_5510 [Actinomycetota bacterium]|nr:hypothetical protein FACS1894125_5510 [Actinomycetota bacterium]
MRRKIQRSLILQTLMTICSLILIVALILIFQPQKIFESKFSSLQVEVISKPPEPPAEPPAPEPTFQNNDNMISSLPSDQSFSPTDPSFGALIPPNIPQVDIAPELAETETIEQKPLDPEVIDALNSGLSFIERPDENNNQQTLFLAYRVSGDTVIRISAEKELMIEWLIYLAVMILFAILIILLLAVVLSRFLAKGFSRDISQIHLGMLDDQEQLAKIVKNYPELNNFVVRLEDQTLRRKQFSSNISHELKSPVSALRRQVEVINYELSNLDNVRVQKSLTDINNKCTEINELIDAILRLSELDESSYNLNLSQFDLVELISAKVEEFKQYYPARSISFKFSPVANSPNAAYITADKVLISTLLNNLMENGLKYGSSLLLVELSIILEKGNTQINLKVINDGDLIPADDLPHIFERFYRVDKGRSRAQKGHGIGLSVAKAIVGLHNGDISCTSTAESGTTFEIRLEQSPV